MPPRLIVFNSLYSASCNPKHITYLSLSVLTTNKQASNLSYFVLSKNGLTILLTKVLAIGIPSLIAHVDSIVP